MTSGSKPIKDRAYATRTKDYIEQVKLAEGCRFCEDKEAWPTVSLGFHHVYPEDKTFNISRSHIKYGIAKVAVEIAKCIVVCHNHHAMLEAGLLEFDKHEWKESQ